MINPMIPNEPINFKEQIATLERVLILDAINKCDGNKTKAAQYLTIKRTTMIQKMKALGLSYLLEPVSGSQKAAELDTQTISPPEGTIGLNQIWWKKKPVKKKTKSKK